MSKDNAYIIDDDPVVVEILKAMLLRKSFCVTTFAEGTTALQALIQSKPENFPNIILLDYMLENETGLEVLAQIRSIPGGENISIIMLSSNSPDEITTIVGTKPNAFLQKPFTAADLDMILSSL